MNNFKDGGFRKKEGFGGRSQFGSNRREGAFGNDNAGNRFSNARSQSDKPTQLFSATCSECGKSCEVPFRPSGDKPVYCSNCFGKKNEGGSRDFRGGDRREAGFRPNDRSKREDNRPRSDRTQAVPRESDGEIKQRLSTIEAKLNRILDLINPPQPASGKAPATPVVKAVGVSKKEAKRAAKTEVDKPALKQAVEAAVKKNLPKKTGTKKVTKKTPLKKVTKKVPAKTEVKKSK